MTISQNCSAIVEMCSVLWWEAQLSAGQSYLKKRDNCLGRQWMGKRTVSLFLSDFIVIEYKAGKDNGDQPIWPPVQHLSDNFTQIFSPTSHFQTFILFPNSFCHDPKIPEATHTEHNTTPWQNTNFASVRVTLVACPKLCLKWSRGQLSSSWIEWCSLQRWQVSPSLSEQLATLHAGIWSLHAAHIYMKCTPLSNTVAAYSVKAAVWPRCTRSQRIAKGLPTASKHTSIRTVFSPLPSAHTHLAFIAALQGYQMIQKAHSQPTPMLSLLVFTNTVLKYSCVPGSGHQPKSLQLWIILLK